jgi:hypothetical protein
MVIATENIQRTLRERSENITRYPPGDHPWTSHRLTMGYLPLAYFPYTFRYDVAGLGAVT